jgi:hypothetical protein
MRKKHGKTSLRVVEKCPDILVAVARYTFTQVSNHRNVLAQE